MEAVLDAEPIHSSARPSSRSFAAQREHDPESSLMHFRARSYDPRTGRFIQNEPLFRNRPRDHYIYGTDNPVIQRDPTGLQATHMSEEMLSWLSETHSDFAERRREAAGDFEHKDPRVAQEFLRLKREAEKDAQRFQVGLDKLKGRATTTFILPDYLFEFFGNLKPVNTVDLTRVRLVEGLPCWAITMPRAITLGFSIFFDAGWYKPTQTGVADAGVELIGHEVFHVYQNHGNISWYIEWVLGWLTSGSAERGHPLENPAYTFSDALLKEINGAENTLGDKLIKNGQLNRPVANVVYTKMNAQSFPPR